MTDSVLDRSTPNGRIKSQLLGLYAKHFCDELTDTPCVVSPYCRVQGAEQW